MPASDFIPDDTVLAALLAAGAPPEVIAAARGAQRHEQTEHFEVWPENWQSVELFLDLATSWTWLSGGLTVPARLGLPATQVQAAIRMLGLRGSNRTQAYRDVRTMESAVLEELSK
ncbi:hypothetical protein ERD78_18870 [Allopusillimonas soli]|uniref:DUF1799 domain-containing protein n=1 Tax=Allopusillimonas soli TaxID=659016 RepID=A0A853FG68_9BURK|nr:DUF1799 domain-containing protein [Allopusillimonas soli]NYT38869.1 DUF1799 domain-containing protein [Allopusillimonas soli]TEA70132.1 hypothetical protein ERD78_18870 [Allopusillimonas soli]